MLVLSGLLGAVFGSFANVVASRGPRKWGLVDADGAPSGLAFPPSRCEACRARLGPLDLVPVLSFLALRGQCRSCGAPIGARHLLVEVLGAAIGVAVAWRFGVSIDALLAALFLLTLLTLAVIDAETGYLPDALTLPLLALGLAAAFVGRGPGPLEALAGAAVAGGGLFVLAEGYRLLRGRDGLGGGDVKLLAAIGAWLGPWALPFILLAASLSGLAYAGAAMLSGRKPAEGGAEVRFGPFLAAAAALVFLSGVPLSLAV